MPDPDSDTSSEEYVPPKKVATPGTFLLQDGSEGSSPQKPTTTKTVAEKVTIRSHNPDAVSSRDESSDSESSSEIVEEKEKSAKVTSRTKKKETAACSSQVGSSSGKKKTPTKGVGKKQPKTKPVPKKTSEKSQKQTSKSDPENPSESLDDPEIKSAEAKKGKKRKPNQTTLTPGDTLYPYSTVEKMRAARVCQTKKNAISQTWVEKTRLRDIRMIASGRNNDDGVKRKRSAIYSFINKFRYPAKPGNKPKKLVLMEMDISELPDDENDPLPFDEEDGDDEELDTCFVLQVENRKLNEKCSAYKKHIDELEKVIKMYRKALEPTVDLERLPDDKMNNEVIDLDDNNNGSKTNEDSEFEKNSSAPSTSHSVPVNKKAKSNKNLKKDNNSNVLQAGESSKEDKALELTPALSDSMPSKDPVSKSGKKTSNAKQKHGKKRLLITSSSDEEEPSSPKKSTTITSDLTCPNALTNLAKTLQNTSFSNDDEHPQISLDDVMNVLGSDDDSVCSQSLLAGLDSGDPLECEPSITTSHLVPTRADSVPSKISESEDCSKTEQIDKDASESNLDLTTDEQILPDLNAESNVQQNASEVSNPSEIIRSNENSSTSTSQFVPRPMGSSSPQVIAFKAAKSSVGNQSLSKDDSELIRKDELHLQTSATVSNIVGQAAKEAAQNEVEVCRDLNDEESSDESTNDAEYKPPKKSSNKNLGNALSKVTKKTVSKVKPPKLAVKGKKQPLKVNKSIKQHAKVQRKPSLGRNRKFVEDFTKRQRKEESKKATEGKPETSFTAGNMKSFKIPKVTSKEESPKTKQRETFDLSEKLFKPSSSKSFSKSKATKEEPKKKRDEATVSEEKDKDNKKEKRKKHKKKKSKKDKTEAADESPEPSVESMVMPKPCWVCNNHDCTCKLNEDGTHEGANNVYS